jgi:hypothetical protein
LEEPVELLDFDEMARVLVELDESSSSSSEDKRLETVSWLLSFLPEVLFEVVDLVDDDVAFEDRPRSLSICADVEDPEDPDDELSDTDPSRLSMSVDEAAEVILEAAF